MKNRLFIFVCTLFALVSLNAQSRFDKIADMNGADCRSFRLKIRKLLLYCVRKRHLLM